MLNEKVRSGLGKEAALHLREHGYDRQLAGGKRRERMREAVRSLGHVRFTLPTDLHFELLLLPQWTSQ